MSKRPNHLAEASETAAKNVLLARSALANACRNNATAEAISEARESLRAAKVARLRADADLLAADPTAARRQVLILIDGDPDVKPTPDNHSALDLAQAEAVRKFFKLHPRPRVEEWEPDPWTGDVHRAYQAVLDVFDACHVALGCSSLSPCRRPAVTVQ